MSSALTVSLRGTECLPGWLERAGESPGIPLATSPCDPEWPRTTFIKRCSPLPHPPPIRGQDLSTAGAGADPVFRVKWMTQQPVTCLATYAAHFALLSGARAWEWTRGGVRCSCTAAPLLARTHILLFCLRPVMRRVNRRTRCLLSPLDSGWGALMTHALIEVRCPCTGGRRVTAGRLKSHPEMRSAPCPLPLAVCAGNSQGNVEIWNFRVNL